jgi:hypothetical protein
MALPIAAEAAVGARVAGIADGVSHLTDAKELGEQREKGIKRKDDKENKADVRTNVYHFPDENLQPSRKSKRLASEAFDDYHSPRYHQNSDYALFGGYQLADSYRSHKQPKYSDPLEDVGDHLTDNEIRKITEESDEDPDSLLLNNPFDSADENETDDDEGDFDYHDPLAL